MQPAPLPRLATVLLLALVLWCGAGSISNEFGAVAAEPVRASVAIKNRKVDADRKTIRVIQGDAVELTFTSDEAAELHLHGYDRTLEVAPGRRAVLTIDAKIAGRFSIEAHRFGAGAPGGRKHHVVLLYLEVHPR